MGRRRNKQDVLQLARGFVEKSEARVSQQKQLIAALKQSGKSTQQAEKVLSKYETALLTLRNHLELTQELMKPPHSENCLSTCTDSTGSDQPRQRSRGQIRARGEHMLSQIRGACSPETFAALLEIFDSAWAEIEAARILVPHETEDARAELAALVIAQMERSDLTETAKLREEILEVFWQNWSHKTSR